MSTDLDKRIASAVSFAASMTRKGHYLGTAISIASNYYKVPFTEVQKGMSARSGKSRTGKKQAPKPVRHCDNGDGKEAVWHCTLTYGYAATEHYYMCADCGKALPAHHESHEWKCTIKWTRYAPSKVAA